MSTPSSPPTISGPSSPVSTGPDLRHITSSSHLAAASSTRTRTSVHLQSPSARLGSRSPASIPSSPTSVHSSSSAIFERDIEPLAGSSPPDPHHNPHRNARQLDQSVPSVLDSAAEVLTAAASPPVLATSSPRLLDDDVEVVAPATVYTASPITSRSPSPRPGSLLLSQSLTVEPEQPAWSSVLEPPPVRPVPSIQTSPEPHHRPHPTVELSTPTSAYYSLASGSGSASPATTTAERLPSLPPSIPSPGSQTTPSKRLSFMSYSDLLASTPAALLPLSALTHPSAAAPPAHIPAVLGDSGSASGGDTGAPGSRRDSVLMELGLGESWGGGGGEWEREGLGRGLEERLEKLMSVEPPVPTAAVPAPAPGTGKASV
ncbi:hypothetical protein PLICRDRAFT_178759 [Plicaturopsis crispa FD-325 SS-3]|nr:hypothetical protein PLICRDRAFT_178759 [Plicaturopsis crispa FD-325 SS-3]